MPFLDKFVLIGVFFDYFRSVSCRSRVLCCPVNARPLNLQAGRQVSLRTTYKGREANLTGPRVVRLSFHNIIKKYLNDNSCISNSNYSSYSNSSNNFNSSNSSNSYSNNSSYSNYSINSSSNKCIKTFNEAVASDIITSSSSNSNNFNSIKMIRKAFTSNPSSTT